MRKIRIKFCVLIGFVAALIFSFHVKAADNAIFHVQTADVQEDGTIIVTVYMTDTENLGGVDAEIIYDPAQVTYISSEIGEGFTDGIGETNHLAERSAVKCLVIYPEAKTAHGELMRAVFKLNGAASYQPQFQIVELVDGSLDIAPLPYTITYQQADGNWTDTPDVSGIAADSAVIQEAQKLYGVEGESGQKIIQEKAPKENGTGTEEIPQKVQENETKEAQQAEKVSKTKTEKEKDGSHFLLFFVIGATVVMIIAAIIIYKKAKGRGKRRKGR